LFIVVNHQQQPTHDSPPPRGREGNRGRERKEEKEERRKGKRGVRERDDLLFIFSPLFSAVVYC
jgi:hypothetical protein